MLFLKKVVTPGETHENVPDNINETNKSDNTETDDINKENEEEPDQIMEQSSSDRQNLAPPKRKAIKRNLNEVDTKMIEYMNDQLKKGRNEPENPNLSFFKGILPQLSSLNEDQMLEFQSGVLNLLQNIKSRRYDCGFERSSGGNNGEFDGTEYAVCTGSGSCTKKINKGKQLMSSKKKQISVIKKNPVYVWLENLWQSDITLRVMKPWLQLINKKSLATKNMKLYQVVQIITKIMKVFLIHAKKYEGKLDELWLRSFRGVNMRRRIIHDIWEAPSDGLGRRFERDIIRPLFRSSNGVGESSTRSRGRNGIFIIGEHERHLHVIHDCQYSGSTCRCIHIQSFRDYVTEDIEEERIWITKTKNKVTFQKEKSPSKRPRKVSSDDEYTPGSLFQEVQQTQGSVEEESEPDVDICPEMPKKKKKVTWNNSDSEKKDVDEEEDYAFMVANLAQAHSLVQTTGKSG
ncbi:unnamed protein product [Colias eurytheme]|nr:unnamed protein product [Colias eurytheme]